MDKWKKFLGFIDGIKIFSVDGHYVRTFINTDFTLGSHSFVEKYIPDGEIWVEQMLNKQDEGFNLAHEVLEYTLMKYKKITYDDSHHISLQFEGILRNISNIILT